MIVRLARGWEQVYPELTIGNVYRVLGIEADHLRILDDAGEPILFDPRAFEIVDATQPADWVIERGAEGETYAYPPALREPRCFFERYFDRDEAVRSKFHYYVHTLCFAERALVPPPPNAFARVQWKHAVPTDPVTFYCELDPARHEVRRIEIFADGHSSYASVRCTRGLAELATVPMPPLSEIAADPQLEPAEISREEFEGLWERVLDDEP